MGRARAALSRGFSGTSLVAGNARGGAPRSYEIWVGDCFRGADGGAFGVPARISSVCG